MKRFSVLIVVLSIFSTMFLTSCEEPGSKIIGLWLYESIEHTVYEDDELRTTATQYLSDDDVLYWEFQDMEMLFYEGQEKELEQTYSWIIENGEVLILSREGSDDIELEIISLTRKELVLMEVEYDTDGDRLTVIEKVYRLSWVEE